MKVPEKRERKITEVQLDDVAILPKELLANVITQLTDNHSEIKYFAGEFPNEDTLSILEEGQKLITSLKTRAIIIPDPWEALVSAEMVLADWEAAKRKGYIAGAKKKVYTVMDQFRLHKKADGKEGRESD